MNNKYLTKDLKILIVGLGLIGGSYAKSLMAKGYKVYAITKKQEDIDFAKNNQIIVDGTTKVLKSYVSQFDLVIFALYPKIFLNWIEKYHNYFKKGAIINDVSGVKSNIVYKISNMLPNDVEFVASHPMAGKEVYGVKNSDPNIFKDANFIITPTNKNTSNAIKLIEELGKTLEFANISILSCRQHDEMIAFLSQLTHCIAVSLMACKPSHHLKDYTGDSFRDLTRIANINENMWSELFLLNKNELLSQMDLFINKFNELKDYIANDDIENMKKMMRLSTKRRKYFNK